MQPKQIKVSGGPSGFPKAVKVTPISAFPTKTATKFGSMDKVIVNENDQSVSGPKGTNASGSAVNGVD